ncbi:MAG: ligase-associated DNA damage response endonuclease PdeM [Balneola sp.]|nr:MAG: ligase-associated DNA damage response endonuclease PdeM [Balneola sp.]
MISKKDFQIELIGQEFILTPEKAMFWINQRTLILSDLHLGKTGHFQKSGIPVPSGVNNENLNRIDSLIERFKPNQVLFLGDLFHSDKNIEWELFKNWRTNYSSLEMILAMGNHDFYSPEEYEALGLICTSIIDSVPFTFCHDYTLIDSSNKNYTISGHIHPSVILKGKARQKLRIPCFYFGEQFGLLPAFGGFTGTHPITPKSGEQVYGIVNQEIVRMI